MGALAAMPEDRGHIICSSVEHPSVLEVCRHLATCGYDLTELPVDGAGLVSPDDLEGALRRDTLLVSVMHANNEVGTVQPVAELAGITAGHGAVFHTDAAQTAGKLELGSTGAHLVSIASHKFYGPKGTGALMVRGGTRLKRVTHGAGHEMGLRPGTENVIGIAGMGTACRLARRILAESFETMLQTRDRLHSLITERTGTGRVRLNGHPELRLPNTLSLGFMGIRADMLMRELAEGLAVSAGAACHGEGVTVSPVLSAMGVPREWASGTIRFSTGRGTTIGEVTEAAEMVADAVAKLTGERRT
jgi:cysteine desulfurase